MEDQQGQNQNSSSKIKTFLPLYIGLSLCIGVIIGAKMSNFNTNNTKVTHSEAGDLPQVVDKFRQILYYVDNIYVDSVNTVDIAEEAISQMLKELDPHTSYIKKSDVALANSQLEGDFEGIGVEFSISNDTLMVVTPLAGGPSESAGIQAGDRIVSVDDDTIAGTGLTSAKVFNKLRGVKGSVVKLGIFRKGQKSLSFYNITRDKIPTKTLDAAYMIDDEIGYLKVTRFGAKTYEEFRDGLRSLKQKGLKKLILDLRGNPGGYMHCAVQMVDEFIPGKELIVYTDGKGGRFDEKELASNKGLFEEQPLIVLINEGSASASEIVSGALQDHDRALIVGRRSFGKGLVQKPIPLVDGSEMRLTISRYYTPSGRSIQKPYEYGNEAAYQMEMLERYQNGEVFQIDSSKIDPDQRFKTSKGRLVFGGGGIFPDLFTPRDTTYYSKLLEEIYDKNVIREFTADYVNENKGSISHEGLKSFVDNFDPLKLEGAFLKAIAQQKINLQPDEYARSKQFLYNRIKAQIARLIWYDNGYYQVANQQDKVIQEAIKHFDKAADLY